MLTFSGSSAKRERPTVQGFPWLSANAPLTGGAGGGKREREEMWGKRGNEEEGRVGGEAEKRGKHCLGKREKKNRVFCLNT